MPREAICLHLGDDKRTSCASLFDRTIFALEASDHLRLYVISSIAHHHAGQISPSCSTLRIRTYLNRRDVFHHVEKIIGPTSHLYPPLPSTVLHEQNFLDGRTIGRAFANVLGSALASGVGATNIGGNTRDSRNIGKIFIKSEAINDCHGFPL